MLTTVLIPPEIILCLNVGIRNVFKYFFPRFKTVDNIGFLYFVISRPAYFKNEASI